MNRRWLALAVAPGTDVVLPLESVDRLVHRTERGFGPLAAAARDIGAALGCETGRQPARVLVVLVDGTAWTASDLLAPEGLKGCRFLAVPPDLTEGSRSWCRGLLSGPGGKFFIVDPEALSERPSP